MVGFATRYKTVIGFVAITIVISAEYCKAEPNSPKAKEAKQQYREENKKALEEYNKKLTEIDKQYLAALREARTEALAAENLDEALEILKVEKELTKKQASPKKQSTKKNRYEWGRADIFGEWRYSYGDKGNKGVMKISQQGVDFVNGIKREWYESEGKVFCVGSNGVDGLTLLPDGRMLLEWWGNITEAETKPSAAFGVATRK